MTEILGVIPARAGSKTIPRKNLRPLRGKPLVLYTVEAATGSKLISRVVLSTDDRELVDLARHFIIDVPYLRPSHLAEDDTPDLPVFQDLLRQLAVREKYYPDLVVHLRPTTPFKTSQHIDEAIRSLLDADDYHSVRSVCEVDVHPLKVWSIQNTETLVPFVPETLHGIREAYNQPRQMLPRAFQQNGAVDVTRPDVILRLNSMTGTRIKAYEMDVLDSVDIDTELDWLFAEWLMGQRSASDER